VNSPTPIDYSDVFQQLSRDNVRYVVVGSFAAVLHGDTRDIADLDIVISREPQEATRAIRSLAFAGFVPTLPLPLTMVSVMRLFDSEGRELDVFVRYAVPFEELLERSAEFEVGQTTVRIASIADLIRAKQTRANANDLEDVKRLSELLHPK
jgi:hypothetical protein